MMSHVDAFSKGKQSQEHTLAACVSFVRALPARFIHRLRTGGVRFLIQFILANVAVVVSFRILVADEGRRYQAVFPWAELQDEVVPGMDGGLRIVAFGSQDMYGSALRSGESSQTWLQTLCHELSCSSLDSFIPPHDSERALTFTDLYRQEVEMLNNSTAEADFLKTPAADYSWLEAQYPIPSQAPDLPAQVQAFLSMPPPDHVPRQTLWVFTFGTWDVWKLSAMPIDQGIGAITQIVNRLVEYLEILNFKSLDPESVAFSDFWFNATKEDIRQLAAKNAADKVDTRRLESFRVLIPELFDISLTPGWQERPRPLFPHTKGEQMRNAAVLTRFWNTHTKRKLDDWQLKGAKKPNVTENANGTWTVQPMTLPEEDEGQEKRDEMISMQQREIIYAPYPRRMAFQPSFAKDLVESMTEEGMQRARVEDSLGHGTWSLNHSMRFLDIWKPCLTVVKDKESSMHECDDPNDHLFLDEFTISQRASGDLAKRTAVDVVDRMFRKSIRKATR